MIAPTRIPAQLAPLRAAVLTATEGLPVIAAYLFGSWATAYANSESDIDVALLPVRPLTWPERQSIVVALEAAVPQARGVDLVDLSRADSVIAAHIVVEGELLLSQDESARQRFEMLALGKYVRLNEERAGILADIQQRGSIFVSERQHG